MDVGPLDKRVSFLRKSVTQDPDYGTEIVTRVLVCTVWANIQDVLPSRAESVAQGLAVARNASRVRIRYRSDIDSSMMLDIWRPSPVTYQIIGGPAEINGRLHLELMVEKISS